MYPLLEFLEGFLEKGVPREFRVFGENELGFLAGDGDESDVQEVFHRDIRNPRLACPEERSRTAEREVSLCDRKAAVGLSEDL